MAHEQKTRYIIKKEVEHRRMCSACGGIGRNQNGTKCLQCNNGVSIHWHSTEIELQQALVEMGLIKSKNEKI